MTATSPTPTFLSRLALVVVLALIGVGLLRYGLSAETHQRVWRDVFDRTGGPMSFRFILQPVMATVAALADGIRDAKLGRTPYLWAILFNSNERVSRLSEGLNATARILLLGVGMDAIYQYSAGTFFPGEAVTIAVALAFIPYLILRGPISRVARWWMQRDRPDHLPRPGG
jgi:hypothetical protein